MINDNLNTHNFSLNGSAFRKFIKTLSVSILLWSIFLLLFLSIGWEGTSPIVVLSFFRNGFLFYGMLLTALKKRSFSLDLMHALFLFSFMFFAPFVQYLNGRWSWELYFSEKRILITNLLLLVWSAAYLFFRNIRLLPQKKDNTVLQISLRKKRRFAAVCIHKGFLTVCVGISCIVALYLFVQYGTALFSRSTNQAFTFANSSVTLIVSSVVPAFVTGTMAMALFNVQPHGTIGDWLLLCVQTVVLFIVCFPTGMARFQMAVIYVGLLLIAVRSLRKGSLFLWIMTFGLIVIFPVVNAFRTLSFEEVDILETLSIFITSFTENFSEGHYDAYVMFMLVQEYVAEAGVSYGVQLLGAILFWVPRSWWVDKPLGSGRTAAEFYKWSFSNLSCPLPAEGFINFGVLGIVLFAAVFSKVVRWADNLFWKGQNEPMKWLYPFLIPFLFFMMRGDLMNSFAYISGFAVTIAFLYIVNRFTDKIKRKAI